MGNDYLLVNQEREFESLLAAFGAEADLPQRFFRADMRLNDRARDDARIHQALDRDAEFWAIASNGLHTSTFVALYRLFDSDSRGNIYDLLDCGQKHLEIFSKTALARRKGLPVESIYEATIADFINLRSELAPRRRLFDDKYRPIRGKVLAHRVLNEQETHDHYANTLITEVNDLCTFFPAIHDSLFNLYMNGVRPVLRFESLSIDEIRKGAASNQSQHAVVRHADRMLEALVRGIEVTKEERRSRSSNE